jgi:predicted transcriptional regulator
MVLSKMVQRRSWPDIFLDILEACLKPSNKMRIMYKSNLNYERFKKYFNHLLKKGFIEKINESHGRIVYKTTKRGKTLLEVLKKAQELLSAEIIA